jgi:threonine/homoserine/homoserine lactone efflux protein
VPSAGTLAVFLLVATGVIVVPGPSNLYVLGRGLQSGPRAAVAGACGCATAALTYVVATAAGLSALIASSEALFAAIHYAGAAYLCALGVIALRRGHDNSVPRAAPSAPASVWPAYRQGVLVELGNPKVALFFLALFPQFIHRGAGPAWLQVLILGALFTAIGLASDSAYAVGSGRLRAGLASRRRRLPWGRLTGVLYIGLGLWAAFGGADRRAPAASR